MGDATTLTDLRRRVARTTHAMEIEGTSIELEPLPTDPQIAALLPGGGLRRGAAYALSGSTSLLFRLLAPITEAGLWCGVVGLPDLGYEAAAEAGVDLGRLVVVPTPGRGWLGVAATLSDALPVIVVRPTEAPTPAVVARLSARLRHQGGTLLAVGRGAWPQCAATFSADEHRWSGLGAGHGHLREHEITVTVADRSGVRRTAVLHGA